MQGSTDIPLDEEGIEQARKLGAKLATEQGWDIIFTSHLSRAKRTGEIIAEAIGLSPVLTDERLREVSGGQTEGTVEEDRIAKWGPDWRQLDLGIEAPDAVHERGVAFMKDLLEEHAGKQILIVSHGSFIRHMLRHLTPDFVLTEHLQNTGVSRFVVEETKWSCDLYNCTKHLD
jgi:probable phosphoglycerate mutase